MSIIVIRTISTRLNLNSWPIPINFFVKARKNGYEITQFSFKFWLLTSLACAMASIYWTISLVNRLFRNNGSIIWQLPCSTLPLTSQHPLFREMGEDASKWWPREDELRMESMSALWFPLLWKPNAVQCKLHFWVRRIKHAQYFIFYFFPNRVFSFYSLVCILFVRAFVFVFSHPWQVLFYFCFFVGRFLYLKIDYVDVR